MVGREGGDDHVVARATLYVGHRLSPRALARRRWLTLPPSCRLTLENRG